MKMIMQYAGRVLLYHDAMHNLKHEHANNRIVLQCRANSLDYTMSSSKYKLHMKLCFVRVADPCADFPYES
jgi:hypothetical protein